MLHADQVRIGAELDRIVGELSRVVHEAQALQERPTSEANALIFELAEAIHAAIFSQHPSEEVALAGLTEGES